MALPKFVMGTAFVQKWAEALGLDPEECRRVVIDAKVSDVLVIYVEKLGTERMLQIEPPDPTSVNLTIID